jgi:hypothetical protein
VEYEYIYIYIYIYTHTHTHTYIYIYMYIYIMYIGSLQFSSRCGAPLSLAPSLFHSLAPFLSLSLSRSLPLSFTLPLSAHARPCSGTYRILLCYVTHIIHSCLRPLESTFETIYSFARARALSTHSLLAFSFRCLSFANSAVCVGGWVGRGGVSGLPASERDHGIQKSDGAQKSRW